MKLHFIGIGGIGMSGIAKVLLLKGYKITGSDLNYNENIEQLVNLGAKIFIGHHFDNLSEDIDAVVVSSAIKDDNVELIKAKSLSIPIYKRAEILGQIMKEFYSIAIAGTHGKTTTTAMLYHILKKLNFPVGVIVGGRINGKNSNAIVDKDNKFLIVEADESDASFLHLNPKSIVITNIDVDVNLSSSAFKNFNFNYNKLYSFIYDLFKEFSLKIDKLEGWISLNIDNKPNIKLYNYLKDFNKNITTYAIDSSEADLKATNIKYDGFKIISDIYFKDKFISQLKLSVPGKHNVYNALSALSGAMNMGLELKECIRVLTEFKGVKRRFEVKSENNDILIIDDYAHNPVKVSEVIKAAKLSWPNKRIVAVFQPHRYTRTKLLFEKYINSFEYADLVFITDIYSASEKPIEGINSLKLVDFLKIKYKDKITYSGSLNNTKKLLENVLQQEDILLLLGAGNINSIAEDLSDFFVRSKNTLSEVA